MDISEEKAESVIRDLVSKASSRFRQEFEGETEELVDRALRQFGAKVSRCSWKNSQQWCKWDDDGPVLMPDFTRIYYRKGNMEILVQEYPPQVRLMKFQSSLAMRKNTEEVMDDNRKDVCQYSLALPYIVFLFKFVDGNFKEVRCAFNDRPMKRLEEKPLRPYLSNIDTNLNVCLGLSFDRDKLEKNNVAQQASFVLDHFWHSVYSDEWATHFWNTKAYFQEQDSRLAELSEWEKNSQENALFVVEDVKWLEYQEESFGDIIVKMLEGSDDSSKLKEVLYKEITQEFVDSIKKIYNDSMNSVEKKIADPLSEQLAKELIAELEN